MQAADALLRSTAASSGTIAIVSLQVLVLEPQQGAVLAVERSVMCEVLVAETHLYTGARRHEPQHKT